MDVTDRNTNGTYASPDGGNGTGPGPDRKTALPEETTDWSLDQQQALYDPGFTYPGHRAFFNGVNELSNEYIEDCVTKRADLAEKRRIRNTAAHRVEALRKDVAGIRADAKPGDVIRVYPLQENTADNTAFYDETLPALSLSAAESKALESKGLKSKNAAVAKKQRDFDSKINVATGKLVQLSRLPAAGAQNWTDIFGAFALARDLQSSGTGRVDLYMQSDMVHSVRGNDLSKARLRDAATALQLGTDAAIGFRQNASVRDLDWGRLKLHVYFPQSIDDLSAYPSLVRAYWEGFAKAVGMTVVF